MCLRKFFKDYKIRKYTLSLFADRIENVGFLSVQNAETFVYNNLISDKMGCYMYLMTVLDKDFDRSRYIGENNVWLTDADGKYIIHEDFIKIVSKYLYQSKSI